MRFALASAIIAAMRLKYAEIIIGKLKELEF